MAGLLGRLMMTHKARKCEERHCRVHSVHQSVGSKLSWDCKIMEHAYPVQTKGLQRHSLLPNRAVLLLATPACIFRQITRAWPSTRLQYQIERSWWLEILQGVIVVASVAKARDSWVVDP
jgi:Golgi nucleoside diphosphatase